MTAPEMRNLFNVLYNNIMSNQAPGLNEYEISVFLTKAEFEVLKNYFNPKGNKYQEGMDDSRKRQIDFSNIIKVQDSITPVSPSKRIDPRSVCFDLPSDVMFILNEWSSSVVTNGVISSDMSDYITVVPITADEYQRLMSKPYKYPPLGQAWRLIANGTYQRTGSYVGDYVELISSDTILSYSVRYVKMPSPIITSDLGTSVSIYNEHNRHDCELDPILHEEIVQRAVELAKAAYVGDVNATIQMGQRSE